LEEAQAEEMAKLELAAQSRIGIAKLLIDDQKLDKAKAKLAEVIKLYPVTDAAKVAKKMFDALEDK
jgi:TolA-binding protein